MAKISKRIAQKLDDDSTRTIYFKRWKSYIDDDQNWTTWHFECKIFNVDYLKTVKRILRDCQENLSLSLSNNQEREKGGFFFYFLSWLLYVYDDYSFVLFLTSHDPRKTHRNKKRGASICVTKMWQKSKLWIEKRRQCGVS